MNESVSCPRIEPQLVPPPLDIYVIVATVLHIHSNLPFVVPDLKLKPPRPRRATCTGTVPTGMAGPSEGGEGWPTAVHGGVDRDAIGSARLVAALQVDSDSV